MIDVNLEEQVLMEAIPEAAALVTTPPQLPPRILTGPPQLIPDLEQAEIDGFSDTSSGLESIDDPSEQERDYDSDIEIEENHEFDTPDSGPLFIMHNRAPSPPPAMPATQHNFEAVTEAATPDPTWGPFSARAQTGLRVFAKVNASVGRYHNTTDPALLKLVEEMLQAGIISSHKAILSYPFRKASGKHRLIEDYSHLTSHMPPVPIHLPAFHQVLR